MLEKLINYDPIEEKTRQIKERIALFKITYPWVLQPYESPKRKRCPTLDQQ